jgi:hypothetical protein
MPAVMLFACAVQAEPRTTRMYGYAYDLASGRYIYTEVHKQLLDGARWVGGTIRYFAPDGTQIGVKTLDFSADPYVPVYRFELPAQGYEEGITAVTAADVLMEKLSDGRHRTGREPHVPGMAADSGFHNLLVDHLDALAAGRPLKFLFGVAGQLNSYHFRAVRLATLQYDGRPAVRLRIEPDSLLRLVVDPLVIVYDTQARRLLEYRGVSNVHDPATGKAYNARIVYPLNPPPDAPKNLPPLD